MPIATQKERKSYNPAAAYKQANAPKFIQANSLRMSQSKNARFGGSGPSGSSFTMNSGSNRNLTGLRHVDNQGPSATSSATVHKRHSNYLIGHSQGAAGAQHNFKPAPVLKARHTISTDSDSSKITDSEDNGEEEEVVETGGVAQELAAGLISGRLPRKTASVAADESSTFEAPRNESQITSMNKSEDLFAHKALPSPYDGQEDDSTKQTTQVDSSSKHQFTAPGGESASGEVLPPITQVVPVEAKADGEQAQAKKKTVSKRKKVRYPKLIFNLVYTFYPIIKKVAKSLNFRVRCDDVQLIPPPPGSEEYYQRQAGVLQQATPPDFDVCWIDNPIPPEVLSKLKPYQRISQYPGINVICNKSKLARGLLKMQKKFPDEYDFFPQTYILPVDYAEFKSQFEKFVPKIAGGSSAKKEKKGDACFIVKPDNMCQGRGIFLLKNPLDVDPGEHCVAQRYVTNPYLVDDLKFDLRIYVLLYGVNPLRIFIFKDGLVRFATEPYEKPSEENIDNLFMHLTNYAINKNSENFVQNDGGDCTDDEEEEGTHKRSLKSLYFLFKLHSKPYKRLKSEINDIIVKTLIVAQPSLQHLFRSC